MPGGRAPSLPVAGRRPGGGVGARRSGIAASVGARDAGPDRLADQDDHRGGGAPRPPGRRRRPGPDVTITPADVAEYDDDIANDESNVPSRSGEELTERQMLEALMNQSANDVAYTLAVWDAGSLPAFVAKMNALAASLGPTATHYVDASGYDPQPSRRRRTCCRSRRPGMAIPAFAEVVGLSTVTLPLVGTVHNIVTEIGQQRRGRRQVGLHLRGRRVHGAGRRTGGGRAARSWCSHRCRAAAPPPCPAAATTTPPDHDHDHGARVTARRPTAHRHPPPHRPPRPPPDGDLAVRPAPVRRADRRVPAGRRPGGRGGGAAGRPRRSRSATAVAVWGGAAHPVSVATTGAARLAGGRARRVAVAHVRSRARRGPAGRRGRVPRSTASAPSRPWSGLRLDRTVPEPTWWWRLTHR